MCLIAFGWHAHPRLALALIANRDEFHARAARPAAVQADDERVIGGVDAQAGGSWLQVSTAGRLAAITNLRQGTNPPAQPKSRGALVVDFVRAEASASDFVAAYKSGAGGYGAHTLLLWDGQQMWQAGNRPSAHASEVPPGIHALSNAALDAPWPKSLRLQATLTSWLQSSDALAETPLTDALFAALADPTEAADSELPDTGIPLAWERRLSAAFIKGADYGTRCSTVVLVGHDGELWFEERRFAPEGVPAGSTRWRGRIGSAGPLGAGNGG